jgi:hypothetical protein
MQIVYGSVGMFWGAAYSRDVPLIDVPRVLRSYFMMQQLQVRYTMEPVTSIRYFDGRDWVDTDTALRGEAGKRGQVLTTYRNGLVVAVNANRKEELPVALGGRPFLLPPCGWVARGPDGFLEYSALRNGQRRDFVRSAEYVYTDGRGSIGNEGGVETEGQVIVLRAPHWLRVVAVAPANRLRLHLPALGIAPTGAVALRYTTESGKPVAAVVQPWPEDAWLALKWPAKAFAVMISPQ